MLMYIRACSQPIQLTPYFRRRSHSVVNTLLGFCYEANRSIIACFTTEGQNESSRDFETTQGRSLSHSYTERSRVRIQDVLELNTGEFYGQLVDADFSSFKAQIKTQETGPIPKLVPFMTATTQEVKRNFMRIQEEIDTLVSNSRPANNLNAASAEPPAPFSQS